MCYFVGNCIRDNTLRVMVFIVALLSIVLGAVAQFCLKVGVSSISISYGIKDIVAALFTNGYFFCGVVCYGVSLVLWLYVLSNLELSKAYPMVSLGYVCAVLLGYLALHEDINALRLLGLVLIMIGVFLIARS